MLGRRGNRFRTEMRSGRDNEEERKQLSSGERGVPRAAPALTVRQIGKSHFALETWDGVDLFLKQGN